MCLKDTKQYLAKKTETLLGQGSMNLRIIKMIGHVLERSKTASGERTENFLVQGAWKQSQ